jgi:hypothetical protein
MGRTQIPFEVCSGNDVIHVEPNLQDKYLSIMWAICAKYLIMKLTAAISQHVYFFRSERDQPGLVQEIILV